MKTLILFIILISPLSFATAPDAVLNRVDYRMVQFHPREEIVENLKYLRQMEYFDRISRETIVKRIVPPTPYIYGIINKDKSKGSVYDKPITKNRDNYSKFYNEVISVKYDAYKNKENVIFLLDTYFQLFKPKDVYECYEKNFIDGFYKPTHLWAQHQDAIDIFFKKVKYIDHYEIGAKIFSFSSGVVIAVGNDWKGWTSRGSYRSGGITPFAGNGCIIYDPYSKKMFIYYHMYRVDVKVGDIINAGTSLGLGGDSGLTARIPGHGRHVHLEVFDCVTYKYLSIYKIYKLIS